MFILHTITNVLCHAMPCYAMLCHAMYYAMYHVLCSAIWRRELKAPSEQPCQPSENPVLPSSFTQINPILSEIYLTILSWRQRYLSWSRATLHPLRMFLVESLFPQRWHLSEAALFKSFRLFCVERVWIVELVHHKMEKCWIILCYI